MTISLECKRLTYELLQQLSTTKGNPRPGLPVSLPSGPGLPPQGSSSSPMRPQLRVPPQRALPTTLPSSSPPLYVWGLSEAEAQSGSHQEVDTLPQCAIPPDEHTTGAQERGPHSRSQSQQVLPARHAMPVAPRPGLNREAHLDILVTSTAPDHLLPLPTGGAGL